MAGKVNLKINQGETFKHTFTWLDANGVAVNLTGMTAKMHIRERLDSATPALVFSSEVIDNPDGTITLGGLAGTIQLKLSSTKTSAISWTSAVYDLEVTDILLDVTRVVEGSVSVSKEVTR